MKPKPQWCRDNCNGSQIGQGFAADSGNPHTARAVFIWEAPGPEEVQQGEAAVGLAGQAFNGWLQEIGLSRDQVLITNTLRCQWGMNQYPKGELRKACENACRHWDVEGLEAFKPTRWYVTYHPAVVFRAPQVKDYLMKTLRDVSEYEGRPAVLCGDKALECYAPWLKGGVGAWKGHWWES